MNELDILFKDFCNKVNEGFDHMALLIQYQKSESDEIKEIIKDQENGRE